MSFSDPNQPPVAPPPPEAPQQPVAPPEALAGPQQPPAPPAPAEQPQAPSQADLLAELQALAAKVQELESKATTGQLSVLATDQELAAKVHDLRAEFDTWPWLGGDGADLPQPWDLKGHGLPQPGVTRDHLPGGQPDELSPVVVSHSKPILGPGTAGDAVADLAGLLAKLGYSSSISQGRNHTYNFDDTVAAAVSMFKRDYHVVEDPSQFPDARQAETLVGPWVWEAVLRAAALVG